MQPYYFPYLGHFALMSTVKKWVVFDTSQYRPKSWMNRNKVAKDKESSRYISASLIKSSINISINEAVLADPIRTMNSHLGMLEVYRKSAPYYTDVCNLFKATFAKSASASLVDINISCLKLISRYLGLSAEFIQASTLSLDFIKRPLPGEWAGLICNCLHEREYINPVGGSALFDKAYYNRMGIDLRFHGFKQPKLERGGFMISENLSVLHYLMFYSPEEIRQILDSNSEILTL